MSHDTVTSVAFFAAGEPKPQGSIKAFRVPRSDRVIVTSDNSGLKGWRLRIATEAQRAMEAADASLFTRETPIALELLFVYVKPKSTPKRVTHHVRTPDADKLIRAACDSLTSVVYVDDAQVCEIVARKVYGPTPGLHCTVSVAHELVTPVVHATVHEATATGVLF